MASVITRATWTDDDGTGTTGTIINNSRLQADVYDKIDAMLAGSGSYTTFALGGALSYVGALSGSPVTLNRITSTATGTQNDWAPGLVGNTAIHWAGTGDMTLSGIAGGYTGQLVKLVNTGAGGNIFLPHQSTSSSGNQFTNLATVGLTPIAAGGWATYQYNGTKWRLVEHEQGAWITPAYDGNNFVGNVSGTVADWGVQSGDVGAFAYHLRGKTMTLAFELNSTTVANSPTALRIALPASHQGGVRGTNNAIAVMVINNAHEAGGYIRQTTSFPTLIEIARLGGSAFSNTANNNSFYGEITFEVQ